MWEQKVKVRSELISPESGLQISWWLKMNHQRLLSMTIRSSPPLSHFHPTSCWCQLVKCDFRRRTFASTIILKPGFGGGVLDQGAHGPLPHPCCHLGCPSHQGRCGSRFFSQATSHCEQLHRFSGEIKVNQVILPLEAKADTGNKKGEGGEWWPVKGKGHFEVRGVLVGERGNLQLSPFLPLTTHKLYEFRKQPLEKNWMNKGSTEVVIGETSRLGQFCFSVRFWTPAPGFLHRQKADLLYNQYILLFGLPDVLQACAASSADLQLQLLWSWDDRRPGNSFLLAGLASRNC